MHSKELPGLWWLPGSENKVPGILHINERGRSELRLIGSLKGMFDDAETTVDPATGETTMLMTVTSTSQSGIYPRIHGQSAAKMLTLDNCTRTNHSFNFPGGIDSERIHVHQVLENAWVNPEEQFDFTRVRVAIQEFSHFVVKSGIEEVLKFKEKEQGGVEILGHEVQVANVPDEHLTGPDGENITISHTYTVGGDRIEALTFVQDFVVIIDVPDPMPLSSLLRVASAIQDLTTIATGRVAGFKSVSLRHRGVVQDTGSKAIPVEMPLTAQWSVRAPAGVPRPNAHSAVFTMDDFGGLPAIEKWLAVAKKNKSTLARVMGTKYAAEQYANDVFFGCAAALEAYDRDKHGDDIHYVARVKRCIDHAGAKYQNLIPDVEAFAKAVKDNRNTVAHHNAEIADASTEQIVLGRACYWLFLFCLFQDVGVPSAVYDKVCAQPSLMRTKAELAELYA